MNIEILKSELELNYNVDYCGYNGDNIDEVIISINGFNSDVEFIKSINTHLVIEYPVTLVYSNDSGILRCVYTR